MLANTDEAPNRADAVNMATNGRTRCLGPRYFLDWLILPFPSISASLPLIGRNRLVVCHSERERPLKQFGHTPCMNSVYNFVYHKMLLTGPRSLRLTNLPAPTVIRAIRIWISRSNPSLRSSADRPKHSMFERACLSLGIRPHPQRTTPVTRDI
jgi:hypothetical protein